jgi:hypothetical protein
MNPAKIEPRQWSTHPMSSPHRRQFSPLLSGKSASAQLTTRGGWFARTVAAEIEFVQEHEVL